MIVIVALLLALLATSYLLLQNSKVQTFIISKITYQLSRKSNADIRIGKVNIAFFKKVILNDVLIAGQNNDTIFFTRQVSAKIDSFKFWQHKITLNELEFDNNKISISRDSINHFNFSFILDSLRTKKDTFSIDSSYWKINCNQFQFKNSKISFNDLTSQKIKHLSVYNLNLNITDFINEKDSLLFNINNLTLNDGKNFYLEKCSAKIKSTSNKIELQSVNLKTPESEINNLNVVLEYGENEKKLNENLNFDFELENSRLSFSELSKLIPVLNGMKETVDFSGRVYGNLNDLKGKHLVLKTGRNTHATFDFYVNGIKDIETMYIFLDLKKLETSFDDISDLTFPATSNIQPLEFSESLYQIGMLSYNGNFSGFISDFVTFGTLKSKMGILKTDLSVIPDEHKSFKYNGKLATTEFKLGEFLNVTTVKNITFNGEVDGSFDISNKAMQGFFKGEIAKIEANNYEFKNIHLDGVYIDKMFDGMLSMNDSNLQFTFLGRLDLGTKTPEFDFSLNVDKALLAKLNLSDKFPKAEIACNMRAKFTGNKIDNLKGVILVEDGYYKNRYGDFSLKGLQLISVPNPESSELVFNSEYFDIEINGNYQFQNILYAFKNNINQFLPSFDFKMPDNIEPNVFDFKLNIKKLDDLTTVFAPDFKFETPFFLYGKMNSNESEFQLEGSIPGFQYKNFRFRNIFIGNKIIEDRYSSKFKIGEILHKNGFSVFDFTVESEIANDTLLNSIAWDNEKGKLKFSAIKTRSLFTKNNTSVFPIVNIEFFPSAIFLTDTLWHYNGFSASIDSSAFSIHNFNLYSKDQRISINGNMSKDSTDNLFLAIKNIDLNDLDKDKTNGKSFGGQLNCFIDISNLYKQPVVVANATIDSFEFENQFFGEIALSSGWDQQNSQINTQLELTKNNRKNLAVTGSYKPKTKGLDFVVSADSLPTKLLETVIKDLFSDFTGFASGNVKFGGTLEKFTMDGAAKVSNGGLKIDYLNTNYFLDDSIYFKTDTILFDNITIHDMHNNTGNVNGILVHDNFKNMLYDFTVNSPKILALNTSVKSNDIFFGEVYANCKISILGRGTSVGITGSATTISGTNVNILMEYSNEIEQYDFLEFVNNAETNERDIFYTDGPQSDFNINLTIEATPDAKVQLIYNSQIGDIIKAQGEGIFLFGMNKDGDVNLSGNYTVTKGDYLFTLQNLVNKRFTIAPGGTIIWSGDPYNAIIDISAIYKLKASLSDLMDQSISTSDNLYQRIPVECVINLTEELINPNIEFEVKFPMENEGTRDRLQQYFNTVEEKNKQILSLIVLGKFFTPEYMRGNYEAQNPNMIGTTASELFSNQLSNWLSQISNNVDVGFKYRPGNSITNDELELALSTQIFNDRVTLDGNIGNNVNPETKSSSQIVGDFDIRVKLVPSGKIQFKAYNHSNNNLIYETAPYTQGIGITFKEEYNTFRELMNKIRSIFKRKKEN